MRRIVSVWFPNFPLDRFKRRLRLEYPGRARSLLDETLPFALTVKQGQALHIAVANRAARQGGVGVGQALADAFAVLPGLQTRPLQPQRDAHVLKSLARWCIAYAPWTAVDGDDGLLLDITGVAHLFGGEQALLHDLARRLEANGFDNRLGVAPTPAAAWALARFAKSKRHALEGRAEGLCDRTCAAVPAIPSFEGSLAQRLQVLAPLPVEALRLAADDTGLLRRLGLTTIGQVAAMPRAGLARRFSWLPVTETVLNRLDQMFGFVSQPISPLQLEETFQVRQTFLEPCLVTDGFGDIVTGLLERLCQLLEAADQGARALTLIACRSDASLSRIAIRTARASRDAVHLGQLFEHKLGKIDPGFGIDAFVLRATRVEPLAATQSEFQEQEGAGQGTVQGTGKGTAKEMEWLDAATKVDKTGTGKSAIYLLCDRLANRLGRENIFMAVAVASHIPEKSERVSVGWAPQNPTGSQTASVSLPRLNASSVSAHDLQHLPPRPLRLFEMPERIEVELALPDARPHRFRWRRVVHHVHRISGPERILAEWWSDLTRPQPARDYYDVEDCAGHRFWIFREHVTERDNGNGSEHARAAATGPADGRWLMHGLFP